MGDDAKNHNKQDIMKSETSLSKTMEFQPEEKKYKPMFDTELIYDGEIYNKFVGEDIKENDETYTSGINLIQAINKQDNYYQVYKKLI